MSVAPSVQLVLDAADRLRSAQLGKPYPQSLRILASYAGLQIAHAQDVDQALEHRRHAAIEGAAALILVAEHCEPQED